MKFAFNSDTVYDELPDNNEQQTGSELVLETQMLSPIVDSNVVEEFHQVVQN